MPLTPGAPEREATEEEIALCLNCTLPDCIEPSVRNDFTIAPRGTKGHPAQSCPWIDAGYLRRERWRLYDRTYDRKHADQIRERARRPEERAKHRQHYRAWYARKKAQRALQTS